MESQPVEPKKRARKRAPDVPPEAPLEAPQEAPPETPRTPLEPKRVRMRKPREVPEVLPVVVDAKFMVGLGTTLRNIQRDDRHTKLSAFRIA